MHNVLADNHGGESTLVLRNCYKNSTTHIHNFRSQIFYPQLKTILLADVFNTPKAKTKWPSLSSCPADREEWTRGGGGADSRGLHANSEWSTIPAPPHNTPAWPWRQTSFLGSGWEQKTNSSCCIKASTSYSKESLRICLIIWIILN